MDKKGSELRKRLNNIEEDIKLIRDEISDFSEAAEPAVLKAWGNPRAHWTSSTSSISVFDYIKKVQQNINKGNEAINNLANFSSQNCLDRLKAGAVCKRNLLAGNSIGKQAQNSLRSCKSQPSVVIIQSAEKMSTGGDTKSSHLMKELASEREIKEVLKEENTALKEKLRNIKKRVVNITAIQNKLEEEITLREKAEEEVENYKRQVDRLRTELESRSKGVSREFVDKVYEEMKHEEARRIRAEEIVKRLSAELKDLKEELRNVNQCRTLAVSMANEMRSKCEELEANRLAYIEETKSLKDEVKDLSLMIEQLRTEAECKNVESDRLRKKLSEARQDIESLSQKTNMKKIFRDEILDLDAQLMQKIKDYADLSSRYHDIDSKYKNCKTELEKLNTTLQEISGNFQVTTYRLQEIIKSHDDQRQEIRVLRKTISEKDGLIADLKSNIDHINHSLTFNEKKIKDLQDEITNKEETISKLRKSLESELETLRIKEKIIEDQMETIRALKACSDERKQALGSIVQRHNKILEDFEYLQSNELGLRDHILELRQEVEALRAEAGKVEKQKIKISQMEVQYSNKEREWEEELLRVRAEKDEAVKAARSSSGFELTWKTTKKRKMERHSRGRLRNLHRTSGVRIKNTFHVTKCHQIRHTEIGGRGEGK